MTYLEKLKTEAEAKAIPALAGKVRQLAKEVASIEDRILFERGDVQRREENLATFRDEAAAKLATSTSRYVEWQNRFRRLTVDLAAARDGLALLETVIAPKTKLALQEAREKLSQTLAAACLAVRPAAEAEMARLLDVVVAEHDLYIDASKRLHEDHGCAFVLPAFYHPGGPRCQHSRIARVGKHLLTDSAMYLAFTLPPAQEAAPVDVPDRQAALGATISDAVDSQDAPDAPGATPTPALDTSATSDAAPTASPGVETSAQDASGRTISDGADTQTAPEGVCEKKGSKPTGNKASPVEEPAPQEVAPENGTTLRTGATPGPAGMDPDADTLPPDLDPEAEGGAI